MDAPLWEGDGPSQVSHRGRAPVFLLLPRMRARPSVTPRSSVGRRLSCLTAKPQFGTRPPGPAAMNSFFLASLAQVTATAPLADEPQLLDLDGTVFVSLGLF